MSHVDKQRCQVEIISFSSTLGIWNLELGILHDEIYRAFGEATTSNHWAKFANHQNVRYSRNNHSSN